MDQELAKDAIAVIISATQSEWDEPCPNPNDLCDLGICHEVGCVAGIVKALRKIAGRSNRKD